jgi:Zn-dependent protease
MIPIPPLDGHKILTGILPNFWYPILAPMERYGFMLLFLLILVGGAVGGSIFGAMVDPVENLLATLLGLDRIL